MPARKTSPHATRLIAWAIVSAVLLWGAPGQVSAGSDTDLAQGVLFLFGARVLTTNTRTGQESLCQGVMYVIAPDPVPAGSQGAIYVVTAAHCLDAVARPRPPRVIDPNDWVFVGDSPYPVSAVAMHRRVCVFVADARVGRQADMVYRDYNTDLIVLRVSVPFNDPLRWMLRFWDRPLPAGGIPVLSVLSSGGGPPVVSSGLAMPGPDGAPLVILPVAPGTSGALVVDLDGNMVGMVVTGRTDVSGGAGVVAGIVPARTIADFTSRVVDYDRGRAATLPPPVECAP